MSNFMKNMKQKKPTDLFSQQNRGGVTGGNGYNFQDSFITFKLPEWLTTPGFKYYIKEGIDDASVHFEGNSQTWCWLYQMKNHALDTNGLKEILKNFNTKANHPDLHPQRFIIGCFGANDDIKSLWEQVKEYRHLAKGMTDAQLAATKTNLVGKINSLGFGEYVDMIMKSLDIEYGFQGMRDNDISIMQNNFIGTFKRTKLSGQEEPEVVDRLFTALSLIVNKKIRTVITRQELEEIIRTELATAKKGPAIVVYLHGWINQSYDDPSDVVVDWTKYFDHSTLKTPSPEVWQNELLPELLSLRQKFDSDGKKRNVWLRSKAPLSAGLAFGNAFPEALGYNIQIEQPSPGSSKAIQYWQTDTPDAQEIKLTTTVVEGDEESTEIAVAVGATDDPRPKVEEFLMNSGIKTRASLYLYPESGPSDISIDEQTAVGFARATKKEVRSAISKFSPKLIHLFFFGPLGLAVLLGQKMNGLVNIKCYERSKEHGYVPSCLIQA